MSDVRIRINYNSGYGAIGSFNCIQMDSTVVGTTGPNGDGLIEGDNVVISDGDNAYTFVMDPDTIVPDLSSLTVPVRVPYGITGTVNHVQDALYNAIRDSSIGVIPNKDINNRLSLANNISRASGNVDITGSYSTGDLFPYGMSGGADSTGHTRFTAMTPAEVKKVTIPLGADSGTKGEIASRKVGHGIGGNTAYADINGCLIKNEVFTRLVTDPGSEIINNILNLTEGPTSDSLLLVESIPGATAMTPGQIRGFTGEVV